MRNPRIRSMVDQNWNKLMSGSNVSDYATDNSSGDLAIRDQQRGAFRFHHKFGGETFFSPGNRGSGRQSRAAYEAWRSRIAGPTNEATTNTGFFRKGIPMRRQRGDFEGSVPRASLLDNAREAGMVGRVEGSASLDITLNGFPRGTNTRMSSEGLLKQVRLNRGQQMTLASEEG